MCYGCRFVWVTDCYAVKFLLSYNGANQAVLRLQMRLMGWDIGIVHCTNNHLVDADYWSRLDADLCNDPSFCQYLHIVHDLRKTHPPPTTLPMRDEHMPYYRSPWIPVEHCPPGTSTDNEDRGVDHPATALATQIATLQEIGPQSLCIHPVRFGRWSGSSPAPSIRALYNNEFPALAYRATNFSWAMYGSNSRETNVTISRRSGM